MNLWKKLPNIFGQQLVLIDLCLDQEFILYIQGFKCETDPECTVNVCTLEAERRIIFNWKS